MKTSPPDPPMTVIRADAGNREYWSQLWEYRELLGFFAWRDLLVRYKQTVIGVAWAVIRPLLIMLVLVFVFGRIAKLDSGGVPYPILVFAALLPWQFFANALGESSASLVANANLVSKVYFPRLVLPLSSMAVALVDFAITLGILAVLMAVYLYPPTWRLLALPALTLMALLAALGPGLLTTALNVRYRDFRYVVPFLVQFGLYISPVGFDSSVVGEKWRLLYSANPMVGVIDGFRWAICENAEIYWPGFALSLGGIALLLFIGIVYFRRTERYFADLI